MTTTPHKYSNPQAIRSAMRRAALYLVHDPEIADRRAQADEFLEGAVDALRRALILSETSGDPETARRCREALDALKREAE